MKRRRRPTAVNVLGKSYSIRFFRQLPDGSAGYCHNRMQLIQVATRYRHPQYVRDTMLHELIHAIDYQTHLKLSERQTHALAAALLQVLWGSPTLVRWLLNHE